jgi:hypothetical protein
MIRGLSREFPARQRCELEGGNVKYIVLMYADLAQTNAMTSEDREVVARKHAAMGQARERVVGRG